MCLESKVRKLLALAQSSNEHEAAAAFAAAQALITKHNLKMAENAPGGAPEVKINMTDSCLSGKRVPTWKRHLLNIFAQANGCVPFAIRSEGKFFYYLAGTAEAEAVTKRLYFSGVHLVERLQKQGGRTIQDKNSFRLGVVQGIKSRVSNELEACRKEASTTALAVVDSRTNEARNLLAENFILSQQKTRKVGVTKTSFNSGFEAGQNAWQNPDRRIANG